MIPEDIIHPVVSALAGSKLLLIDYQFPSVSALVGLILLQVYYQSSRVSSAQQSVLWLDRYFYWWTISPRGYHPTSSQCFGWIYTYADRLLVLQGIIHLIVNALARSILLQVNNQSPKVSQVQQSVLWLDRFLCWWTIRPRGYHLLSSQCFGWVDTFAGGLLVPGGIICPLCNTLAGLIHLLVDYLSRGYHTPSSQCFGWIDTSADRLLIPQGIIHPAVNALAGSILLQVNYYSPKISSVQQSVLWLDRFL